MHTVNTNRILANESFCFIVVSILCHYQLVVKHVYLVEMTSTLPAHARSRGTGLWLSCLVEVVAGVVVWCSCP